MFCLAKCTQRFLNFIPIWTHRARRWTATMKIEKEKQEKNDSSLCDVLFLYLAVRSSIAAFNRFYRKPQNEHWTVPTECSPLRQYSLSCFGCFSIAVDVFVFFHVVTTFSIRHLIVLPLREWRTFTISITSRTSLLVFTFRWPLFNVTSCIAEFHLLMMEI